MRKSSTISVTSFQLFALVFNSAAATGIFTLARDVGDVAGRGAILSVPLAGILSVFQLWGMYLLASRFPGKALTEYAPEVLGPWAGKAYLLGYALISLGLAAVVPRNFWIILTAWVFRNTPQAALMIPTLLVCWNVARRGIVVLSRVSEIVFLLTVPLVLVMISAPYLVDPDYLIPLVDRGIWAVVKGVMPGYFAMTGFDIFLIAYPYAYRKQALKIAAGALGALTAFYTALTALVIGSLSLELTLVSIWPLEAYLHDFAYMILERLDVVILTTWFFQVLLTTTIPLFIAAFCLRGVFPRLSSNTAATLMSLPVLVALLFPVQQHIQSTVQNTYSYLAFVYIGFLPFLLWLIAVVRGKGGEPHKKGHKNTPA